uniref:Peptidase M14 carboxypeptidase A domain-containing protein n=1 Tax=Chromera velia CCMP2878 TaxID=1169474 RepID=A0A0K6S9N2_9ALVE|eukprot:Cvel_8321.t1-p1 / transcript=Cvel_8321.t1 / gene=Cvel_8321 / organism=Chromera_velia_CCMP2878 / gene_product=Cytosolic carboxypeptidase 2, putative / transcript_product=Cytosolic carboxypeptidase 2, putative / location=Cvel_scaffold457:39049-49884(+) / protein_length=1564 / sequence_SO=supercontig / SO=protein_coding / is_pseudo=false
MDDALPGFCTGEPSVRYALGGTIVYHDSFLLKSEDGNPISGSSSSVEDALCDSSERTSLSLDAKSSSKPSVQRRNSATRDNTACSRAKQRPPHSVVATAPFDSLSSSLTVTTDKEKKKELSEDATSDSGPGTLLGEETADICLEPAGATHPTRDLLPLEKCGGGEEEEPFEKTPEWNVTDGCVKFPKHPRPGMPCSFHSFKPKTSKQGGERVREGLRGGKAGTRHGPVEEAEGRDGTGGGEEGNAVPPNTFTFRIVNLSKPTSLYSHGLLPLTFSEAENQTGTTTASHSDSTTSPHGDDAGEGGGGKESRQKPRGWRRRGSEVRYVQNSFPRTLDLSTCKSTLPTAKDKEKERDKDRDKDRERERDFSDYYFTVEFKFTFEKVPDTVYFCHSHPYTFTHLRSVLSFIKQSRRLRRICRVSDLCKTESGVPCPILTISDDADREREIEAESQAGAKGGTNGGGIQGGGKVEGWSGSGSVIPLSSSAGAGRGAVGVKARATKDRDREKEKGRDKERNNGESVSHPGARGGGTDRERERDLGRETTTTADSAEETSGGKAALAQQLPQGKKEKFTAAEVLGELDSSPPHLFLPSDLECLLSPVAGRTVIRSGTLSTAGVHGGVVGGSSNASGNCSSSIGTPTGSSRAPPLSLKQIGGKKMGMIITSRVHPGETNASWILQGFLSWALSELPDAIEMRKNFVIKVIPMLNIDGVVRGNYRYSNGVEAFQHPSLCGKKVRASHFSDLFGKRCAWFSPPDCKYRIEKLREGTGRVVAWKELEIPFSFTLEASLFGSNGVHTRPLGSSVLCQQGAAGTGAGAQQKRNTGRKEKDRHKEKGGERKGSSNEAAVESHHTPNATATSTCGRSTTVGGDSLSFFPGSASASLRGNETAEETVGPLQDSASGARSGSFCVRTETDEAREEKEKEKEKERENVPDTSMTSASTREERERQMLRRREREREKERQPKQMQGGGATGRNGSSVHGMGGGINGTDCSGAIGSPQAAEYAHFTMNSLRWTGVLFGQSVIDFTHFLGNPQLDILSTHASAEATVPLQQQQAAASTNEKDKHSNTGPGIPGGGGAHLTASSAGGGGSVVLPPRATAARCPPPPSCSNVNAGGKGQQGRRSQSFLHNTNNPNHRVIPPTDVSGPAPILPVEFLETGEILNWSSSSSSQSPSAAALGSSSDAASSHPRVHREGEEEIGKPGKQIGVKQIDVTLVGETEMSRVKPRGGGGRAAGGGGPVALSKQSISFALPPSPVPAVASAPCGRRILRGAPDRLQQGGVGSTQGDREREKGKKTEKDKTPGGGFRDRKKPTGGAVSVRPSPAARADVSRVSVDACCSVANSSEPQAGANKQTTSAHLQSKKRDSVRIKTRLRTAALQAVNSQHGGSPTAADAAAAPTTKKPNSQMAVADSQSDTLKRNGGPQSHSQSPLSHSHALSPSFPPFTDSFSFPFAFSSAPTTSINLHDGNGSSHARPSEGDTHPHLAPSSTAAKTLAAASIPLPLGSLPAQCAHILSLHKNNSHAASASAAEQGAIKQRHVRGVGTQPSLPMAADRRSKLSAAMPHQRA